MYHIVMKCCSTDVVPLITELAADMGHNWRVSIDKEFAWVTVGPMVLEDCHTLYRKAFDNKKALDAKVVK